MHMADALISPAVGGVMWAATAAAGTFAVKKLKRENIGESKKIPLMGVAGAFVFAAQMINFAIPGTGSSGHIGGGMLLAALLGPSAGFLVLSVVLAIQALFFADGGLLALGCNIFNMGALTCFVAYPLVMRPILNRGLSRGNIFTASVLGAVTGLLAGAFAVVAETFASGITALPFGAFAALMLPIHLAIGAVEGLVTAAVLVFIKDAEPSLLEGQRAVKPARKAVVALAVAAVVVAGLLSWFVSSNPDGLEWSIEKTAGTTELESRGAVHESLAAVQESVSFLPDYGPKNAQEPEGLVNPGGSAAGIAGSVMVLGASALVGLAVKKSRAAKRA